MSIKTDVKRAESPETVSCPTGAAEPVRLIFRGGSGRIAPMPIILSIFSALCYGAGDFTGSVASRRTPVLTVLVFSQAAGLVFVLAVMPFLDAAAPSAADLAWGALAGLGGAAGLALIYSGIAKYGAGVVSPTGALVGTAIPVLFGIVLGERPGIPGMAGIIVSLPAILLLTAEPKAAKDAAEPVQAESAEGSAAAVKRRPNAAFLTGAAAGVGFGVFFIAVSLASEHTGLWPLVAARAASISAAAAAAFLTRKKLRVSRPHRWTVPLAGVLDMGANVLFLLAVRSGLLVLVSVITSLYPAPTVLLSRIVYRERLTSYRLAGLALAVTGVALMSM